MEFLSPEKSRLARKFSQSKGTEAQNDMEILTCNNFYQNFIVLNSVNCIGGCLGQEMVQSVHAGKFCMAQIGLGP